MSRAETAALLVDLVLNSCGVGSFQDFAAIVNDEDGARHFLEILRAAAAQPPGPVATVTAATPAVNVVLRVAAPPPPPITANVVL